MFVCSMEISIHKIYYLLSNIPTFDGSAEDSNCEMWNGSGNCFEFFLKHNLFTCIVLFFFLDCIIYIYIYIFWIHLDLNIWFILCQDTLKLFNALNFSNFLGYILGYLIWPYFYTVYSVSPPILHGCG